MSKIIPAYKGDMLFESKLGMCKGIQIELVDKQNVDMLKWLA